MGQVLEKPSNGEAPVFFFLMRCTVSNVLLHSPNHNDFLDNLDNGKDLDDIDFEELNKIDEDWAARKSVEAISGPSGD